MYLCIKRIQIDKMGVFNHKGVIFILQLLGWGVILGLPMFWNVTSRSKDFEIYILVRYALEFQTLFLIYLLNYVFFLPNYLFKGRKVSFFLINTLLIIALLALLFGIQSSDVVEMLRPEIIHKGRKLPLAVFFSRNILLFLFTIGFVTSIRLIERLTKSEVALREAEGARVKAELANLRSQINPHFLLNTLNNIYALTAFNTEQAQKAIMELSHLLRYILYDNQVELVILTKEAEFLSNYIELMRIRLHKQVKLEVEFKISPDSSTQVAPLIFISFIENAFKHGVSAGEASFIYIYLEDNPIEGEITLSVTNSNNAKTDRDKSGSGIGLNQIQRRLDLQYPNAYSWDVSNEPTVYSSLLILKTPKQ